MFCWSWNNVCLNLALTHPESSTTIGTDGGLTWMLIQEYILLTFTFMYSINASIQSKLHFTQGIHFST